MTAPKPASIPYHDEVSPLVTLADLEKPASITDREAVDLVDGLNVEEWADKAEKRGDTIRDLNAVLNSASAALAEHGVREDVQETQTLAESIHQAVEAVRREVLAEVSQAMRDFAERQYAGAQPAAYQMRNWAAAWRQAAGWVANRAEATPHADDTEAGS